MQKRTREIIALILLIVLIIAGVSAMAWYILVGHNWNAAATSIDDRIGSMDGYTVILCEGSVPPLSAQYEASVSQPMLEEQNYGSLDERGSQANKEPLTVEEAVASYLEKNAQVVTVHIDKPQDYLDPVIVSRNGKRFAVFSVQGPRADLAARIALKDLQRYDVDFTICILDDMESISRGLGGVDLAICTDFDEAGEEGRYIGKTYVLGSPYDGQIGAVIMAPSGFLSSKMVDVA